MEKLKDLSLSSDEPNETLMIQLQAKTDDFMKAICATKDVTTKAGTIKVKPLSADAYKKVDAFIGAIDDVIRSYQNDKSQMKEIISALLKTINLLQSSAECTNGTDQRYKELHQTIDEQKVTICHLNKDAATMAKNFEENVKVMEEKFKQMKAAEVEMQAKCALMEQKQETNKKLEQMEAEVNAKLTAMKLDLGQKDNTVQYWKQKHDEANRLSETKITELNQKIARLEAQLQMYIQNNTRKIVVSKLKTFDPFFLEVEIAELKNRGFDLRENDAAISNKAVELKDVLVKGEIDYAKLNGKVLIVDRLMHDGANFGIYYKGKMIKLQLNDSFKLHLKEISPILGDSGYYAKELCKHIHSCTLKSLTLECAFLSFNDFFKLVESRTIEDLYFKCDVRDENGKAVPLEKILQYFPNLKTSIIQFNMDTVTASNFLKLPIFKNLVEFTLLSCPIYFDLKNYGKFMKKHSFAQFVTYFVPFRQYYSLQTINKLQDSVNQILDSWPDDAPKPNIIMR